jgi:hypothetical protein
MSYSIRIALLAVAAAASAFVVLRCKPFPELISSRASLLFTTNGFILAAAGRFSFEAR